MYETFDNVFTILKYVNMELIIFFLYRNIGHCFDEVTHLFAVWSYNGKLPNTTTSVVINEISVYNKCYVICMLNCIGASGRRTDGQTGIVLYRVRQHNFLIPKGNKTSYRNQKGFNFVYIEITLWKFCFTQFWKSYQLGDVPHYSYTAYTVFGCLP